MISELQGEVVFPGRHAQTRRITFYMAWSRQASVERYEWVEIVVWLDDVFARAKIRARTSCRIPGPV